MFLCHYYMLHRKTHPEAHYVGFSNQTRSDERKGRGVGAPRNSVISWIVYHSVHILRFGSFWLLKIKLHYNLPLTLTYFNNQLYTLLTMLLCSEGIPYLSYLQTKINKVFTSEFEISSIFWSRFHQWDRQINCSVKRVTLPWLTMMSGANLRGDTRPTSRVWPGC